MIQANELRIGNWVKYKNKYYQIYDGIRSLSIDDLDSEKLDSHLKNIKLSDLEPIEITEEILLKCGFEIAEKNVTNFSVRINVDAFEYLYLTKWSDKDFFIADWSYKKIKNIQYLHQLQNLYFALTNEELNVKL